MQYPHQTGLNGGLARFVLLACLGWSAGLEGIDERKCMGWDRTGRAKFFSQEAYTIMELVDNQDVPCTDVH